MCQGQASPPTGPRPAPGPAPCTHLPSVWSFGSGTRGLSPSPPSRGCTGASVAQEAALGQGERFRGARAMSTLPSRPAPSRLHPCSSLGFPWEGLGLPLRNSWVRGSRSQQPGVLGELRSHLSVAWKAFFRTWSGKSGAAGPGGVSWPACPRPPSSAPAPAPALGCKMGTGCVGRGNTGLHFYEAEASGSGRLASKTSEREEEGAALVRKPH